MIWLAEQFCQLRRHANSMAMCRRDPGSTASLAGLCFLDVSCMQLDVFFAKHDSPFIHWYRAIWPSSDLGVLKTGGRWPGTPRKMVCSLAVKLLYTFVLNSFQGWKKSLSSVNDDDDELQDTRAKDYNFLLIGTGRICNKWQNTLSDQNFNGFANTWPSFKPNGQLIAPCVTWFAVIRWRVT